MSARKPPAGICGLTWERVRVRSARRDMFCSDCFMMFHDSGVPCLKHTLPSEQPERAKRIAPRAVRR